MRGTCETICVLCLATVALGWHAGYHSLVSYVIFWLLTALVTLGAVGIARAFPPAGMPETILRIAIVAFAMVVLAGLVLGSLALITPSAYLATLAGFSACSWWLAARSEKSAAGGGMTPDFDRRLLTSKPHRERPVLTPPLVARPLIGLLIAVLALIVGVGITIWPPAAYDSLSYHLFFPARWLQEHRLSIIPTPFSDEAQAYSPANGELYFLWLMLPFHGDLFARIGQVPFYLAGGLALYAIARRIGATREHAVYAPAFYFLSRPVVEQALGADVDLICWSTFLTSIYFGIVAVDRDDRRDWVLWGVSLGLCWGSKYVSLVYSPILLLLPLVRGLRPRAVWALPGIAALALPWYLRNGVIAGSPLYPASLTIAGATIARGAYSRTAMLNSVFHTTDFGLFPAMASHAFGTTTLVFWLPCAAIGAWSILKRRQWWPAGFVLAAPVVMVPLYWLGVPDNVDSRFLLPVAMLAMLLFPFAFRANRIWNACLHGAYLLAMGWILLGVDAEIPMALPWYMGGWLSLQGLLDTRYVLLFAAIAAAGGTVAYGAKRVSAPLIPILVVVWSLASVVIAMGADAWCAPASCEFLHITSAHVRAAFVSGWSWTRSNIANATIAYTGNNVPYSLTSDRLTNRVVYVNIDRHLTWRFHDYDRAQRLRLDGPAEGALATSSGVLVPGTPQRGPVDAVRPRYERMIGDRAAWLGNLRILGVQYLFVTALSAYEIDYVWHNPDGFPIEDDWAKADPRAFSLVYANAEARIYRVTSR